MSLVKSAVSPTASPIRSFEFLKSRSLLLGGGVHPSPSMEPRFGLLPLRFSAMARTITRSKKVWARWVSLLPVRLSGVSFVLLVRASTAGLQDAPNGPNEMGKQSPYQPMAPCHLLPWLLGLGGATQGRTLIRQTPTATPVSRPKMENPWLPSETLLNPNSEVCVLHWLKPLGLYRIIKLFERSEPPAIFFRYILQVIEKVQWLRISCGFSL